MDRKDWQASASTQGASAQGGQDRSVRRFVRLYKWLGFAPLVLINAGRSADLKTITIAALCITGFNLLISRALHARGLHKIWPKSLDVFNVLLFASLVLAAYVNDGYLERWLTVQTNGGICGFMLLSILVRHPFTLDVARDGAPEEIWNARPFLLVNYIITGIWTGALAVATASAVVASVECPTHAENSGPNCTLAIVVIFQYVLQLGPVVVAALLMRVVITKARARAAAMKNPDPRLVAASEIA